MQNKSYQLISLLPAPTPTPIIQDMYFSVINFS